MKYLAFDLGASSGKMMLANLDQGKMNIKLLHRFPNRQVLINGALYWDIIHIFQNLKLGLDKAIQEVHEPFSLGIDSFCNDFGLIDRNGFLMSQVRCYRDARTDRRQKEIYQKVPEEELYQRTGAQIALFNTGMQMASMVLEGDTHLLDECDCALLIPDLLTYFLSGEKHTEYTLASVTQLMDWKDDRWAADLMKRLGVRPDVFPEIIQTGTVSGKVSAKLNPEIGDADVQIVAVPGHDTASAVAALPTEKEHVAYISSGTWSLVGTEVLKPVINEKAYEYNIAYEGGVDHRYRMIKNVMGLWVLQECCHDYELRTHQSCTFELVDREVEKAEPLRFFIDPDDQEFYMPGNMLNKVADFCEKTGQERPESFGQIVRCVLESLAMKYRYAFDVIEEIIGYELPEIYILGGGGQNRMLDQFVANACRRTVYAGPSEAALAGNVLSQMQSTGEISDLKEGRQIIRNSFEVLEFEPCRQTVWEDKYQNFRKLIKTK